MKITSYLKNSQIRYFVLFVVACLAASQADVPGFGLILIGIWMQVANVLYLKGRPLTKESQILFLKYFIACIPLILIIGSVNAFFPIYWKESELFKLSMVNIVQLIGSFLVCLFMIFIFSVFQNEKQISEMVIKVIGNIKLNVLSLAHITLFFWALNFVTQLISDNESFFALNFAISHIYWIFWTGKNPIQIEQ